MLEHQVIKASAGTGKTFALTTRILRLLALGVEPERIVALTFSRAAAGEIFDKLVARLATAADSAAAARTEAGERLNLPAVSQAQFAQILRLLISRMHLSPIGTLDSFFVRMIRTFPFEFGISGDFSILDEHNLALQKDALFREILLAARLDSGTTDEPVRSFLEVFKQATFGVEEKQTLAHLDAFTTHHHDLYLRAPDPALWGDPNRIWPDAPPWFADGVAEPAAIAERARALLQSVDLTAEQRERWFAFLDLAGSFTPGSIVTGPAEFTYDKLLEVRENLAKGQAEITFLRRKMPLTGEFGQLCHQLLQHVVVCQVQGRLEATRGLFEVLARYEGLYEKRLRNAGKMTFGDVQYLLARGATGDGLQLSRNPDADAQRLFVDFRLDGAYDHWALDEFQDTSRRQWLAVQNLVDEVIQHAGAPPRTFFAVGDVKQAIHRWRGGDAALLDELLQRYNTGGVECLKTATLKVSRRSSPPIIGLVNRVFGGLAAVPGLPPAVVERWQRTPWEEHETCHRGRAGYAALYRVKGEEAGRNQSSADKAARYALTAALLRQVRPWRRGWSAAVLVRTNSTGEELADFLRQQEIPAAWQGDMAIADNPLVALFLSLLRFAAHPGDTFCWEHLRMTPLRGALPADRAELSRALLRSVYDHGFARTLELWFEKLQQATALDAFSLSRMEELLSAAHRFDLTGGKDCTEFAAYVESYTSADIPAQGSVRVMTIHRSKGLDFDLVLLPELQEHGGITTLGGSEVSAAFRREPGGAIDWVLSLPKQKVCVTDPVLTAHLQRRMEGDCFEALCVLYVALTRAKRAVYLITSVTGEQTVQLSTVLTRALAAEVATVADFDGSPAELLYADGTPDWYAEQPPQPAAAATGEITVTPEAMPPATAAGLRPRFGRALPSRTEEAPASAATLFLPHSSGARRFGTLMHALFQELDWLDTEPPKDILLRWRERQNPPPDLAHQMEAVFLGVLRKPQLQPLLRKPVQRYDLWREQPFEIILDGDWVSGAFDRVVVLRDGSGNVTSAQILDFKSDWVETEAKIGEATARYRPQIELYRRVLRRLLRLPPRTPVQAVLLFTHPGVAVSLAEK